MNTTMRFILCISCCIAVASCQVKANFPAVNAEPPSHQDWTELLKECVDENGGVNYPAFKERETRLDNYLNLLSTNPPNASTWSEKEQLAYWINVYNAFTVKLILDHYPVSTIKDIAGKIPFVNSPWDVKFITIGDETYNLNNIEHGIIRKQFNEPLIHFAVNCASVSCPKLRPEAYVADRLSEQLEQQTRDYLFHSSENQIKEKELQLSKILKWYGKDFEARYNSVLGFIQAYTDQPIDASANISYLDYNWEINSNNNMNKKRSR